MSRARRLLRFFNLFGNLFFGLFTLLWLSSHWVSIRLVNSLPDTLSGCTVTDGSFWFYSAERYMPSREGTGLLLNFYGDIAPPADRIGCYWGDSDIYVSDAKWGAYYNCFVLAGWKVSSIYLLLLLARPLAAFESKWLYPRFRLWKPRVIIPTTIGAILAIAWPLSYLFSYATFWRYDEIFGILIYRGSLAGIFSTAYIYDFPGLRITDPSQIDPNFHQCINFFWLNTGGVHGFGIPLWLLLIPCVVVAVASIRRLRKPRPGHCAICGYDLCATPDRCPECGATPPKPPPQRTVPPMPTQAESNNENRPVRAPAALDRPFSL